MNIVVTGASGFIGGHLARSLAKSGHHVIGVNRSKLPDFKNISTLQCDLTSEVPLIGTDIDIVIHAAALTQFSAPYETAYKANVIATQRAYEFALQAKAKLFIHISSASVYSDTLDKYRVKESFPKVKNTGNTYAQTKRLAEEYLEKQKGIPIICLRPHTVYGPGDCTILKNILSEVRFNSLILPMSHSREVSITHVGNIVAAVKFFMQKPKKGFQAFNVVDAHPVNNFEILRTLLSIVDPPIQIMKVPQELGYSLAQMLHFSSLITKNQPLLTPDMVFQLNHNSSLSGEKLAKTGFILPYELENGLVDVKNWFTHFQSVEEYLKTKSVWPKMEEFKTY